MKSDMENKIAVLCASIQAFRAHVDKITKKSGVLGTVYRQGIAIIGDSEYVAVMNAIQAEGKIFSAVERAHDFQSIDRCYDLEDIVRRRIR